MSSIDYAGTGAYVLHGIPNPLHCKGWRSFGRKFSANNSFEKTLERNFEEVVANISNFTARVPHPREMSADALRTLQESTTHKRPREVDHEPSLHSKSRTTRTLDHVDLSVEDGSNDDNGDPPNVATLLSKAKAERLRKKFAKSGKTKVPARKPPPTPPAACSNVSGMMNSFFSKCSGSKSSNQSTAATTSGQVGQVQKYQKPLALAAPPLHLAAATTAIVTVDLAQEVLELLVDCPGEFGDVLLALTRKTAKIQKAISETDLQYGKHHLLQRRHLQVLQRMQAIGAMDGTKLVVHCIHII